MTDFQSFSRDPDAERGDVIITLLNDGSLLSDMEGAPTIVNVEDPHRCAPMDNCLEWYFEHAQAPEPDGMEAENCMASAVMSRNE